MSAVMMDDVMAATKVDLMALLSVVQKVEKMVDLMGQEQGYKRADQMVGKWVY